MIPTVWSCGPVGGGDSLQDNGSGDRAATCTGGQGPRAGAGVHPNRSFGCIHSYIETGTHQGMRGAHAKHAQVQYHRMAYGSEDEFVMMWQGKTIRIVKNRFGVWQGAPLGMHGFCLSNMQFMKSLYEYCATWRIFDHNPGVVLTILAWIADDLTLMTRRKNSLFLIDCIIQVAPKYCFKIKFPKSEALVTGPADEGMRALCAGIRERGMVARRHGLRRLLGALIGTQDFCMQEDGHLQTVTNASIEFAQAIGSVGHAQAEYHLLRYCASASLNHLPRLVDPGWMQGYAEQLWQALRVGAQSLLGTTKVTTAFPGVICRTGAKIRSWQYLLLENIFRSKCILCFAAEVKRRGGQ